MATVRKFLFDVEFDAPVRTAPPPPPVVEPPPPTFTESDLAAARAEAHARGREEGLAEAAESIERQTAAALASISGSLEQAGSLLQEALSARHDAALKLAAAVARKLVPDVLRENAVAAVESAVAEILPHVIDEPRLVVRVNEALVESLKEPMDAVASRTGFAGKIILIGDERIRAADCRIEWADGGAEYDFARLSGEIETIIDRILHGVGHEQPARPDGDMTSITQETTNG